MDRRDQNRTDDSVGSSYSLPGSVKDMVVLNWKAANKFFGNDEQSNSQPDYILNRMLSTKSYISTNSSLAEENQRARDDASQKAFKQIGKGQCGTMYALKGTSMVIKLPNAPAKVDELYRDAGMHQIVGKAFQDVHSSLPVDISIPKYGCWVDPTTQPFWDDHGSFFDQNVSIPSYGLLTELIYPLPLPVRDAIVDSLCPKSIKAQKANFLNMAENKDCLVRLYLGRRNVDRSKMNPENIKLRNFPLHVDEMGRLKLDIEAYARVMAQALAVMHWKAGVDANDVEFVLGSAPQITMTPLPQSLEGVDKDNAARLSQVDFKRRSVRIWLLDFNQCNKFGHDQAGLKKLVNGFWWNDPYYPRPSSTDSADKQLWRTFAQHYLEVSAELTNSSMPQMFIKGVEDEGKKRSTGSLFG